MESSQSVMYISIDEGMTFTKRVLSPSTIDPSSLVSHPMLENWVLAHDPDNNVVGTYIHAYTCVCVICDGTLNADT